jgi:drug/metabolite transporter (DMT)-like permease
MWLGLLLALFAAACYGVASAIQAVAARAMREDRHGVDPALLLRLLRQWRYLTSLVFDAIGLVAQIIAVHILPLFLMQAALSASIVVTALLAVRLFNMRLSRVEWTAVAVVCGGLAMLGLSAESQGGGQTSFTFRLALLIGAVALGVLGLAAGQLPDPARTAALGLVGGLGFGALGLAFRVIPSLSMPGLLTNPATYTVPVAGIFAGWFYTSAMQRGGVVAATAMMLIGETVPPALVGVLLLGDHARPGWTVVAWLGFVVALTGALALARFGEVSEPTAPPPAEPELSRV